MNKTKILELIGCTVLISVILFGIISNHFYTNKVINILQGDGNITKAIINIETSSSLKKLVITNIDTLQSINEALKKAQMVDVPRGGGFDISANIYIEKNGRTAKFEVLKSIYYGWRIEMGDKYFRSDYLFKLLEVLSKN